MPVKSRLTALAFMLETAGRLFVPHTLRARDGIEGIPPFFILSSGRSGSTLLRAMLVQQPEVHIPPEFKVIQNLYRQFQILHRFLPWRYVVGKMIWPARLIGAGHFFLRSYTVTADFLPIHS